MKEPILELVVDPDGETLHAGCYADAFEDALDLGCQIAFLTQVAINALADLNKLPLSEKDMMSAQVVESFNAAMISGCEFEVKEGPTQR